MLTRFLKPSNDVARYGAMAATLPASTETSARDAEEFQIELGTEEKRLLEGRLLYPSNMILKVDGRDAAKQFQFRKEARLEIYEGQIGVAEELSVRIERDTSGALKAKVRVLVNGRLVQVMELRPRWRMRHLIFQAVLPAAFFLLIAYYIFISRPEVAHFYSEVLRPQPQRYPAKVRNFPAQTENEKRIMDFSRGVA